MIKHDPQEAARILVNILRETFPLNAVRWITKPDVCSYLVDAQFLVAQDPEDRQAKANAPECERLCEPPSCGNERNRAGLS